MRIIATSILLFVLSVTVPSICAAPKEMQALEILKSDYREAKYWPRTANGSVEFCGGDWCQEVAGVGSRSSKEAWDAIFVMFYFLDPNEDYTTHRRDAAESIVSRSAKQCLAKTGDQRASCTLESLQKKFGFKYRRVQYDVGYRCYSDIVVKPPFFTKKGHCTRMKKGTFPEQPN